MRTWTPKVYELSRERVKELQYFCGQYREKKARIAAMRGGFNDRTLDGSPRAAGYANSSTELRAIAAMECKDAEEVAMIEKTAMEAAEESRALYNCIIANVCDGVNPRYMPLPIGINQFYVMRRKFYWLLDKKR